MILFVQVTHYFMRFLIKCLFLRFMNITPTRLENCLWYKPVIDCEYVVYVSLLS